MQCTSKHWNNENRFCAPWISWYCHPNDIFYITWCTQKYCNNKTITPSPRGSVAIYTPMTDSIPRDAPTKTEDQNYSLGPPDQLLLLPQWQIQYHTMYQKTLQKKCVPPISVAIAARWQIWYHATHQKTSLDKQYILCALDKLLLPPLWQIWYHAMHWNFLQAWKVFFCPRNLSIYPSWL